MTKQKPLHVLVVDDDPDDADFLISAFQKAEPDTRFTRWQNGNRAVEQLQTMIDREDCPDAAFLDLHMPGKNGYQVLIEIRASERCSEFPVMIISTSLLASEAEKCRQAGCNAYFMKPVSLEAYDDIVRDSMAILQPGDPVVGNIR